MVTMDSVLAGLVSVDHVAFAVPRGQMEGQIGVYRMLGFQVAHEEVVRGKDQVREVLLAASAGGTLIQLLEPLSDQSPVQKQIDRNGGRGGFAHIAYRVRDIQATFRDLQQKGFQIVDEAPRPGSRGTTVFFVHPKTHPESALGCLIEVVEESREPTS